MGKSKKCPLWDGKNLIFLVIGVILFGMIPIFESGGCGNDLAQYSFGELSENLVLLRGNSLLPIVSPLNLKIRKIKVVVTGYSSSPWETDDNPFITAAGTQVRDGIVANNLLPFGTEIRVPELYGRKTFVVEDRMNRKKGYYHVDIWFPSYREALNFGSELTYIEILEN